ncbi:MAG: N-acetyl-gamma-glutamyl-phosphate reductase [Alphaproteobacteria bacterium]
MSTKTIRAAILGASGYTGADAVRLLARHPNVEIVVLTADRRAGEPLGAVFPHLTMLDLPNLMSIDEVEWAGLEVDVVFCCLPHGTTQEIVRGLFHKTGHTLIDDLIEEHDTEDYVAEIPGPVKVIDVSADFRLRDVETYAEWYGHEHLAPDLQKMAVYGLTEFYREDIKSADLVACPGCYPTGALLALIPLVASGHVDTGSIIIDAKSGVTGAGRSLKEANLYTEVSTGTHAYGVGKHRHGPEIDQEVSAAAGTPVNVTFTPHLLPMNRGELSTIYLDLQQGADAETLYNVLASRFIDEPFVQVMEYGQVPSTRHVVGSNHCFIGIAPDRRPGRAVVVTAIDNLVKGSSGQAIQNMNLMFGLPETTGLEQLPLFP